MTSALGSARSDDCGSLKEVGLTYVALHIGVDNLTPSIPPKMPKAVQRGFHHPSLGRLLCPAKYLAEFDENPTEYVFIISVSSLTTIHYQGPQKTRRRSD